MAMKAFLSILNMTETIAKHRMLSTILGLFSMLCIFGCEANKTREELISQSNRSTIQTETTKPKQARRLTIGSPAPALQVDHWITTGPSPLPTELKFEPGTVYVVEFWATTCGPCVQTIPHLAELQKRYTEQGLQVIGVTSEPLALVTPFLKREIGQSESKKTAIGEVAKAYHLAADPDGSIDLDYMLAAGILEIPMAFVVGKQGLIEWIGPPLELDDVVKAVLEDRWERTSPQQ